ncbi:MAG: HepT-like ribonuclease domain-containing protein [Eubacterium sp.]|nr:HepT-like ribonuclease domain-containing protein [Eubacterium sp.]
MRNNIIVSKLIRLISTINSYCDGAEYDDFKENSMLVEACVFNLSQMGELVSKLDKEFERQYPEVHWRQLYGLRNRIVHDYEGVNLQLVWQIIEEDLPVMKNQLLHILEDMEE